jgi:hypothetical protein
LRISQEKHFKAASHRVQWCFKCASEEIFSGVLRGGALAPPL